MSVISPSPLYSSYHSSFTNLASPYPHLQNASSASLGTLQFYRPRAISSGGSAISRSSGPRPAARSNQENENPWPSPRERFASSRERASIFTVSHQVSGNISYKSSQVSRKSSWGTDIPPPPTAPLGSEALERESSELQEINLNSAETIVKRNVSRIASPDTGSASIGGAVLEQVGVIAESAKFKGPTEGEPSPHHARQVFQRLVGNLRRRSLRRSKTVPTQRRSWEKDDESPRPTGRHLNHKRSASVNSMAFVTTVKTASASLASLSLPGPSRLSGRVSRLRSGTRSSRPSRAEARSSIDSRATGPVPLLNGGVWDRAVKRRNIIDELISSEESYIADLKVLVNVYFTLLTSVPTLSQHIRSSIKHNVTEIICLHESLLSEMLVAVPGYNEPHRNTHRLTRLKVRSRSNSLDISQNGSISTNISIHARKSIDVVHSTAKYGGWSTAEPKLALDVAKIFDRMMSKFFAYEEYGAKYQDLVRETASAHSTIPAWRQYERGIEALANSLSARHDRNLPTRKGLQFGDLLIKPIQRVCKYPLLFEELFKETPVYDCPETHAELEKVLFRFRETVREVNKATDDPPTRDRIQRTWLLQDRMTFPDQISIMDDQLIRSTMRYRLLTQPQLSQANIIRQLGHVLICGVLHVAWQGPETVHGQYLIVVLFKSAIILATGSRGESKYQILAGIRLFDTKMDSSTNGRGLQCSNALYSWKLIFGMDNRLYEIICSACSAREEAVWRQRIHERCQAESVLTMDRQSVASSAFPLLMLNAIPLASLCGQPGSVARSISVHQATSENQEAESSQVLIRNTHAVREVQHVPASGPLTFIPRSQSLLSTNCIPILAPRRSERVRLEAVISDVWSRDILPYPGMTVRKGEHLIRTSASSVIRKLSIASISRRSPSVGNLSQFSSKAGGGGDDKINSESAMDDLKASPAAVARSRGYSSLRRRGDKALLTMSPLPNKMSERRSSIGLENLVKADANPQENEIDPGEAELKSLSQTQTSLESRRHVFAKGLKKRWNNPSSLVKSWVRKAFMDGPRVS